MNRIRALWNEGRAAIIGWTNIPALISVEALARCGYDGLLIDLQHGAADLPGVLPLLLGIEAGGTEPLVRVAANDAAAIMRLLDFGATGIIVPMIDSADDARAMVAALHYPPRGGRSYGPRRPQFRFGPDYLAAASASVVSVGMIETRAGLDNLEAILAVEGFDGIFIGPSDLALAIGQAPRTDNDDPTLLATVDHIIARCKAAGKRVGIYCTSPAYARRMLGAGCDLVSIAPDLVMLTDGARATLAATRA